MISQFEKRKNRTFSASFFLSISVFILILTIVGFLIFYNLKIKHKKDELNAQIAIIEQTIEDFQNKNEGLREKISRVGDEEYIEKVAREELGLQKEGERVLDFILPADQLGKEQKKSFWQLKNWWFWLKSKF